MDTKVKLAETAGFCFGVDRAVNMVGQLLAEGKKVATLGPIIHNPQLVEQLSRQGVRIVESPCEVQSGEVLVLRSHGVPKSVTDKAEQLGIPYADATCPFVAKIHKIVALAGAEGRTVLIAGDREHKEVVGIIGHCIGKVLAFDTLEELEDLSKNGEISVSEPLTVVSQTTFNTELWKKCQNFLKKHYTNAKIFDTICNATSKRQQEASDLSRSCDVMVVIGGRHSSNTRKLYEVCRKHCDRTVFIESSEELKKEDIANASLIGVVAGASTPSGIIKEVINTMDEILTLNDEMTFEEMLNATESASNTDQKVKGIVLSVSPTEIQVDIVGRKHTGYITASEFSSDANIKLTEAVKVGDELDLIIMRTNDQEGTMMLSKKRFDAIAGWDKVLAAKESNEIIEGTVSDVVKGGVVAFYEGIRVFIPASQATLSRNDSLEALKGKPLSFRIIEIGPRRRVIGSARAILKEQKAEATEKFWANVAVGDRITGTVKSLTGYGAFVDLGGVDGMVHISELSWERIKNPSEVVAVGDTIEVYIKAIDEEKKKISLGYKKADENPWEIFKAKFAVGDVATVKIVSMTAYGAFAKVIPGIDGLIHISQIANRRIEKPADELKVGQEVEAKIIDVDFDKKRVSLSIRALLPEEPAVEETAEEAVAETANEEAAE
ncbi:MAG: bifunctional 4-hydroxy-3-methylbut-2-enyl diphosphate reductase/30S ribosomal protein S1 [Ruminococcaceae bacterium]|nr:bifunctional 4-hydroxy-3-methylbut-2-enyl diphosphate reductase/30S ribosomal protein S1 [Oscillospiraceae bacterium]